MTTQCEAKSGKCGMIDTNSLMRKCGNERLIHRCVGFIDSERWRFISTGTGGKSWNATQMHSITDALGSGSATNSNLELQMHRAIVFDIGGKTLLGG